MRTSKLSAQAIHEIRYYAIVAQIAEVGDRRYSSEEEARIDALERAEQTGYSYTVIKVCGTAVCHKKAEWKGVE